MKKILRTVMILSIVFMTFSCVEDSYEEIEVTDIEVQNSTTDEDDIPPNRPGSCGDCSKKTH